MPTEVSEVEEEEEIWFKFDATLRIFGVIEDMEAITEVMGVKPTHTHRCGDRHRPNSRFRFEHDMWSYTAPIPEDQPLGVHLESLWEVVRPHVDFLKELKSRLTVNIFCGYRTNCGTAGFEVDHRALVIFTELEVPFDVSVIS